jgi:hypothetical protein
MLSRYDGGNGLAPCYLGCGGLLWPFPQVCSR